MEDFSDILKKIKETNNCALLIGNGFSISLYENFHYTNLLSVAKNLDVCEKMSDQLIELFDKLETENFEKIINQLKLTEEIVSIYRDPLKEKIGNDLKKIRKFFIQSLKNVHPKKPNALPEEDKNKAIEFLSNFSKIFTTNYDLITYWFIMDKSKNNKMPKNDGFGFPEGEYQGNVIWGGKNKDGHQNVFFLHGALHLFYADGNNLTKITCDSKFGNIMDQVSQKIDAGKVPLIILEGTDKEKLVEIKKHDYLRNAHDCLQQLEGSLVILGSSLNLDSDKHILNAIKDSKLHNIYIGVYGEDHLDKQVSILEESKKNVFLFNSKTAVDWGILKN